MKLFLFHVSMSLAIVSYIFYIFSLIHKHKEKKRISESLDEEFILKDE